MAPTRPAGSTPSRPGPSAGRHPCGPGAWSPPGPAAGRPRPRRRVALPQPRRRDHRCRQRGRERPRAGCSARAPRCSRRRRPAWRSRGPRGSCRRDRGTRSRPDRCRPPAGPDPPGQPGQQPRPDRVQLLDVAVGERAQERADRRRRPDPVEQPRHPAVAQQIHVVDAVRAGQHPARPRPADFSTGFGESTLRCSSSRSCSPADSASSSAGTKPAQPTPDSDRRKPAERYEMLSPTRCPL